MSASSGYFHEKLNRLRELELEEFQNEELERQRKKQGEIERRAEELLQEHAQLSKARNEERDRMVTSTRTHTRVWDATGREIETEAAALRERQAAMELSIQQLDYDRRMWEKKKREEAAEQMRWVKEQQHYRTLLDPEMASKLQVLNAEVVRVYEKNAAQRRKHMLVRLEIEQQLGLPPREW